jgi:hypothetical protein
MDEHGRRRDIKLPNAYHDPTAPCNLVGLTSLQAAGLFWRRVPSDWRVPLHLAQQRRPVAARHHLGSQVTTTPSVAANHPSRLPSIHTADGFKLARHTQAELDAFQCIACSLGKQPQPQPQPQPCAVIPSGPHEPGATAHGVHCSVDLVGPLPPSVRRARA